VDGSIRKPGQVHKVDVLVIGGGPAGLTAALYLARYRRSVCLIDAGNGRATLIPESHNYPGFEGISGLELLGRLAKQAHNHGAQLENGRVLTLERTAGPGFAATTDAGRSIVATRVLLATGLVDESPAIEGFAHGPSVGPIRFCPICDGFEAIDKAIGVVGTMSAAAGKALFLRTYSRNISLFPTDDEKPPAEIALANVTVSGRPIRIQRGKRQVRVTTENGSEYALDVLYPAFGCKVNSDLGIALNAACDANGLIRTDDDQQTSVGGLYAAGDVVTDLHQISVATGHAALAATHIHNALPRNLR
jgi:thioredoxin reductase (NADPH)